MSEFRPHAVWSDQIAHNTEVNLSRAESIVHAKRPVWKRFLRRLIGRKRYDRRMLRESIIEATESMNHNLVALRSSLDVLESRTDDLTFGVDKGTRTYERVNSDMADLTDAISDMRVYLADSFQELSKRILRMSQKVEQVADTSVVKEAATAESNQQIRVQPIEEPLSDLLYEQLEQRFRGSRKDIKDSVQQYIPVVRELPNPDLAVLDIGCGRGEWLELLADNDVKGYGVDINEIFVKENTDRGLDVHLADAVGHMLALEENSLRAVTGFHIIEHLSVPTTLQMLNAAHHALAPGGIVLFETPNPTNLYVGAANFYLDPTHIRPVHPLFAEFLADASGFSDVQLIFSAPVEEFPESMMRELSEPIRPLATAFWNAINGPQNFAVLATK